MHEGAKGQLPKREAGRPPGFPDNYNLVNFLRKLNDNLVNSFGHKLMEIFWIQSCAVRPVLSNHWATVNNYYQI